MIPSHYPCDTALHLTELEPTPATVPGQRRDPVTGEQWAAIYCPTCAQLLLQMGLFLPDVIAP